MALITQVGEPSLAATLIPHTEQIPHLKAGEALPTCAVVTINSNGKVMKRTSGAPHGICSLAAQVGEGMTIYRNVRMGGFSGLTPGAIVYANATGGLDDAAGTAVGFAVDANRIQFNGF